jgi:hypothetical protein
MIVSQLLASVVGVGLSQLFPIQFHYIALAISVALTTLLMFGTSSVYPPAGATAVLAVLDGRWRFVAVVMGSTGVLVVMGCIWVNLGELLGALRMHGRWPLWWLYEGERELADNTEGDMGISIGMDRTEVRGVQLTEEERRVLDGISRRIQGRKATEGMEQKSEV